MIHNEREMEAAQQWIDYWKSTRHGQSWIGNEQASQKVIQLRRQIDEYRRGQPAPVVAATDEEPALSAQ